MASGQKLAMCWAISGETLERSFPIQMPLLTLSIPEPYIEPFFPIIAPPIT